MVGTSCAFCVWSCCLRWLSKVWMRKYPWQALVPSKRRLSRIIPWWRRFTSCLGHDIRPLVPNKRIPPVLPKDFQKVPEEFSVPRTRILSGYVEYSGFQFDDFLCIYRFTASPLPVPGTPLLPLHWEVSCGWNASNPCVLGLPEASAENTRLELRILVFSVTTTSCGSLWRMIDSKKLKKTCGQTEVSKQKKPPLKTQIF